MNRFLLHQSVIILTLATASSSAQVVLRVDARADGDNDGSSWTNAFVDLQDGLDAAALLAVSDSVEIWVAKGRYAPDRATGDRSLSFELLNNVGMYGGFAGWEAARYQRRPDINITTLSGDLLGDDDFTGTIDGGESNCCFEHDTPGCDDAVCQDRLLETEAVSTFCLIREWDDSCATIAASVCCETCSTRNDCENTFHVVRGDGTDETAVLDGFTVSSGNTSNFQASPPEGPAMTIVNGSPTIRNCEFTQNGSKGHAVRLQSSDSKIADSIFTDNPGGGLTMNSSDVHLSRCLFRRNGQVAALTVSDSLGADSEVEVTDCDFFDNDGGSIFISGVDNARITGCRFIRNIMTRGAGAGLNLAFGRYEVDRCVFIGNTSNVGGSTVDLFLGRLTMTNCLFSGNEALFGPGTIRSTESVLTIRSCTVVNNFERGICAVDSNSLIENCIVWGNGEITDRQISLGGNVISLAYSIIQGGIGSLPGFAISTEDPLFVDPAGMDGILGTEDDDYRLTRDSPAINTGDGLVLPAIGAKDLDGHARVLCNFLDLGAYEFGYGDFNCNGYVEIQDFNRWQDCTTGPAGDFVDLDCLSFDGNADGKIDLRDYAEFQSHIDPPL